MSHSNKLLSRIIGVCGLNASGKSSVCSYFKDQGYGILSLSDALRQELKSRDIPETRENLISMGNELRNKHGAGVLAALALKKLDTDKNYVIDSIRHPDEVRELRNAEHHRFCLIGVDCKPEIRYERLRTRARVGEAGPLSFDEFLKIDQKETNNPDPKGQQIGAVLKQSDILIDNNQDLNHFTSSLNSLNDRIDNYFKKSDK